MKGIGILLADTPFEILGTWDNTTTNGSVKSFMDELGFRELSYTLNVLGIWSAIIVILCALIVLLVVNYPKTVSQTKTKIVHVILTTAAIASLPFLFDCIGGLINTLILGN
jgi:hypothetical protein